MKIKRSYIGIGFILIFTIVMGVGIMLNKCGKKENPKCKDGICYKISK